MLAEDEFSGVLPLARRPTLMMMRRMAGVFRSVLRAGGPGSDDVVADESFPDRRLLGNRVVGRLVCILWGINDDSVVGGGSCVVGGLGMLPTFATRHLAVRQLRTGREPGLHAGGWDQTC